MVLGGIFRRKIATQLWTIIGGTDSSGNLVLLIVEIKRIIIVCISLIYRMKKEGEFGMSILHDRSRQFEISSYINSEKYLDTKANSRA